MDQWNRIEIPSSNLMHIWLINFDEGTNNIQWERIVSSINGAGISTCKRVKLDFYITLPIKINSKLIKDLDVRPKTVKNHAE